MACHVPTLKHFCWPPPRIPHPRPSTPACTRPPPAVPPLAVTTAIVFPTPMQTFLSTRRVRLLEDLLVLTSSLGGVKAAAGQPSTATTGAAAAAGGSLPSSVAGLRRELALARDNATAYTSMAKIPVRATGVVRWSEEGGPADAFRAAGRSSTEDFFSTWAERFGTLLVPLGGGAEDEGGGDGGGGARKDDR